MRVCPLCNSVTATEENTITVSAGETEGEITVDVTICQNQQCDYVRLTSKVV
jgi:hypothetical protein